MYAKWCTMSNLAVPISRLYDFMDWILCSDDCWLVQTWQMLCGLKTILTDMNILNSYRHIRPKKVKYPIPEIPDDSGKKSGTDWVLPKIIGSGRVSGTRQALHICEASLHCCGQCLTGTRYPTRAVNFLQFPNPPPPRHHSSLFGYPPLIRAMPERKHFFLNEVFIHVDQYCF